MIVTWKTEKGKSGPLSDKTVARTSRRISQLKSNRDYKIGTTNNPDRRASEYVRHDGGKYDEMIVLYETGSISQIRELESILVRKHREGSDNEQGGGGGPTGKGKRYYLYIVRSSPSSMRQLIRWVNKMIRRLG